MAAPSASNTVPQKNLNLQITHVSNLRNSIVALRDIEFNPGGIARVDITTERGFQLTVRNIATKTACYLCLYSTQLKNFHCSKPIVNKLICLLDIPFDMLGHTSKEDVTIFHREDDNYLTFVIGRSDAEYPVQFLRRPYEISMFPDLKYLCEALWTTEKLKQMIEHLESTETPQEVSVDISKSFVSIFIGNKHPWIERSNDDKKVVTWGMQPGKHHHAWFKMHNLQMLKKASLVAPRCFITFLTEPAGNVIIRFPLREYGDLVSIQEADVIANSDDFIRLGVEGRFDRPA